MTTYRLGQFPLHSGGHSVVRVDCDDWTAGDVECLAWLLQQLAGPFGSIEGVPRGGLRLAAALADYAIRPPPYLVHPHLIVDDVLTTGGSLHHARSAYCRATGRPPAAVKGAVVYARGPCPAWVRALNQWPRELWLPGVTRPAGSDPGDDPDKVGY